MISIDGKINDAHEDQNKAHNTNTPSPKFIMNELHCSFDYKREKTYLCSSQMQFSSQIICKGCIGIWVFDLMPFSIDVEQYLFRPIVMSHSFDLCV